MKKETIAAVFFGVLLGVVGALILIGRTRLIGLQSGRAIPNEKKITPIIQAGKQAQLLEVSEPKSLSIFDSTNVKISGKASKDALVIIQSPIKEVVLTVKDTSFSTDFPLALGENIISISLYPKDPKITPQQKTLKLYYLDEK